MGAEVFDVTPLARARMPGVADNMAAAMQGDIAAREARAQKQFDSFLQMADDIDTNASPAWSLDLTDPTVLGAAIALLVVLALVTPEFRAWFRRMVVGAPGWRVTRLSDVLAGLSGA